MAHVAGNTENADKKTNCTIFDIIKKKQIVKNDETVIRWTRFANTHLFN